MATEPQSPSENTTPSQSSRHAIDKAQERFEQGANLTMPKDKWAGFGEASTGAKLEEEDKDCQEDAAKKNSPVEDISRLLQSTHTVMIELDILSKLVDSSGRPYGVEKDRNWDLDSKRGKLQDTPVGATQEMKSEELSSRTLREFKVFKAGRDTEDTNDDPLVRLSIAVEGLTIEFITPPESKKSLEKAPDSVGKHDQTIRSGGRKVGKPATTHLQTKEVSNEPERATTEEHLVDPVEKNQGWVPPYGYVTDSFYDRYHYERAQARKL